jgi:hypothetical protein
VVSATLESCSSYNFSSNQLWAVLIYGYSRLGQDRCVSLAIRAKNVLMHKIGRPVWCGPVPVQFVGPDAFLLVGLGLVLRGPPGVALSDLGGFGVAFTKWRFVI